MHESTNVNTQICKGDASFNGLANLTFVSGTQSFGPGSQMCVDISINDDQLVEQTETFIVCGCPTPLAVIPEANGCVNVTIFDNDSKIKLNPMWLVLMSVFISFQLLSFSFLSHHLMSARTVEWLASALS